ncbi:Trichome birefringence-like family [Heracleum sosnowskyi]|uniref:Trichome birefringence-like family n=1 Tax=Heracleum sosnowskyi TaxID=360622 RepID=A0AAD8N594_9APIA|nr:Trichome birefringence-like family [Heracleum sosnowskyi]
MDVGATILAAVLLVIIQYPHLLVHQINGESNVSSINKQKCNIYQGRWVKDNSYPLYDPNKCPFLENSFTCQTNGRPDKFYLQYRWQPLACNLPRFSGRNFLRSCKGKRIMFIGDSIGLNQWQSLNCMLHTAVPQATYTLTRNKGLSTFQFPGFDLSVMLLRNAFVVDLVSDKRGRVLKLDSINIASTWRGMDTLIFNTWHWWLLTGRQQPWDFIETGNKLYKHMDRLVAYEKALTTWARWMDKNVDQTKTKVFFQGVSPDHQRDWSKPSWKNCNGQKQPFLGRSKYKGSPHPAQVILERVLKKMSTKVDLLDITTLSQLRKDGHPSVFGYGGRRGMDCTHWCLPGLPDTWNQLLYASLFQN